MQVLELGGVGGIRKVSTELAREEKVGPLQVDQKRGKLSIGQSRPQTTVAVLRLGYDPFDALAAAARAFRADHRTERRRCQTPFEDRDRSVSVGC